MSDIAWSSNVSTTWSAASGHTAMLWVQHDEGHFVVSDLLGLRYGVGDTLDVALVDWARGVEEFVKWAEGKRLGKSLAKEVAAYRKFLAGKGPE